MATILVVEDDRDLRQMFKTALTLAEHRVLEAESGFQALQLLDTVRPDLVVLDLGLPGLSGFVVRQELAASATTRAIPVVVVTAMPGAHDDLGVACVLQKPVAPETLLKTIEECLASGGGGAVAG